MACCSVWYPIVDPISQELHLIKKYNPIDFLKNASPLQKGHGLIGSLITAPTKNAPATSHSYLLNSDPNLYKQNSLICELPGAISLFFICVFWFKILGGVDLLPIACIARVAVLNDLPWTSVNVLGNIVLALPTNQVVKECFTGWLNHNIRPCNCGKLFQWTHL